MKTLLSLLFVLSVQTYCEAENHETKIVAHRGSSSTAPENSIAAFIEGFYYGADAIEGDFRLTADRKVVCIHDKDTKRTAKRLLNVEKSTLQQLKTVSLGFWKRDPKNKLRIPTLVEVLDLIPEGKKLFLEIKSRPEIVPIIKKEIATSTLKPEQIVFIAFEENVVMACKELMPQHKAYWLVSFKQNAITRKWSPSLNTILGKLVELNADGLDCKAVPNVVTPQFVQAIRDAGKELHVWTVNDLKKARYFKNLGVDSITTDKPGLLKKDFLTQRQ